MFIKLTVFMRNTYEDPSAIPVSIWVNTSLITTMQSMFHKQVSASLKAKFDEDLKNSRFATRPTPDQSIIYTMIEFSAATSEDIYGLSVCESPETIIEKGRLN